MLSITKLKRLLAAKVSEYNTAKQMLAKEKEILDESKRNLSDLQEAQKIVQATAAEVQNRVHQRIATIVTRCLQTVYNEPWSFKVYFEQKRGKTEARMVVVDEAGNETDPAEENGGGVVDLAAFALRIITLLMKKPAARKLLVLDEPFRFLTSHAEQVKTLLKSLSDELDIQFIVVTHDRGLVAGQVVELD